MRWDRKQFILCILAGLCLIPVGGCNIIGLLVNPSVYEQKLKPGYDLKPQSKRKIFVWVDPSPSSGAGVREAGVLTASLVAQLTDKVGVSKKNILIPLNPESLTRDISVRPETLAVQAGAELVLYVHLMSFQATNLHSYTVYSGSILCRGVLLDAKNGQMLWPQQSDGMVADIFIDAADKGRDDLVKKLSEAAAHCMVRDLYACLKTDYKISQERSALNEMIQQEVY